MVDNVAITAGAGTTIASDDIAGVQHQRVKLSLGADGSATDALGGTGTVAAGVQRVTLATDVALPAGTNNIGDVDVLSVVPGTTATALGKAEDAAHTTGDTGVMALAVRNDAGTALATTTGDYIPLSTDANGALRVTGGGGGTEYTEDAAAAADPVGQMMMGVRRDTLTVSEVSADGDNVAIKASSKGELHVADKDVAAAIVASTISQVAHDAAASAVNPLQMGLYAHLTQPTAVSASTDAVRSFGDADGAFVIRTNTNLPSIVRGNANNTDGTSTSVIAASGDAAIKHYLTDVTLTNTSASMIYVELKSGTTTMYTCPVPATGGFTKTFNPPLPPNAANEAWNFDPSAATTTVYCSAIGFKSRV